MSYVLRDYQQKASNAAVSFFANRAKKNNAIMVLPTGAGKSLVIADIASRLEGTRWYSSQVKKYSNRTIRSSVRMVFWTVPSILPHSDERRFQE